MNLLFMSNGLSPYGIPRNGLVSIIDPGRQILTGTTGQSTLDYSGHGNTFQLGSTAGSDTNDPAWSGAGLVFGADDLCKSSSPALDDMSAFTIIAVINPTNGVGEKHFWDKQLNIGVGSGRLASYSSCTSGFLLILATLPLAIIII